MTGQRRVRWSFAVDRAVGWARRLERPLLIVEVLPCGGRWDSDRHHAFVLQGMAEHDAWLADNAVTYYPFAERAPGEAVKLLAGLAARACVIVADDAPLPGLADVNRLQPPPAARVERIDSHGLLPLRAADRAFPRAHSFRRFLHKTLPDHLLDVPRANPLSRMELPGPARLPRELRRQFPPATAGLLRAERDALAELPIDHTVEPVATRGGESTARDRARRFIDTRLADYPSARNHPDDDATSGLSPYLHHGHISVHELFALLAEHEGWSPDRLAAKPTGRREGWWGMSPAAEALLDELITWRELSYNGAAMLPGFERYESLPEWARQTLAEHADDRREVTYSLEQLDAAETHDELWNAAQRQLVVEGRMHNYLRMLWGKKILEWTARPEDAFEVIVELNNRYALDGQDPNSYSGIGWVLGRYDRAWGPERAIFGKIRYMTSRSTRRKLRVGEYVARYT
jgi:deoxyribodipyrimidine photo-lyase